MNTMETLEFTRDKIQFREWAPNIVKMLHSDLLTGAECAYASLCGLYPDQRKFVIQANFACGGYGTILMDEENADEMARLLETEQKYIVSPYVERNIPVNVHAVIFKEEIILTPPSVQIVINSNGKLLYRGADFISYRDIDAENRNTFIIGAKRLCEELQKLGYLGVCGIDAMIVERDVYFLEINNRFQGSTSLLNRALAESGLPSIHALNIEAFRSTRPSVAFGHFDVNYSNFVYLDDLNPETSFHNHHIYGQTRREPFVADLIPDGYHPDADTEKDAYAFKLLFRTNITGIAPDGFVRLHPNISEPGAWARRILSGDRAALKIALLNQGLIVSDRARRHMDKSGGARDGVYHAIDLYLGDMVVNCPTGVKFTALSPFALDCDEKSDVLRLRYYGHDLGAVEVKFHNGLETLTTSASGVAYGDICLLATDRLRVQHSCCCFYREQDNGCSFCEVQKCRAPFELADITEVLTAYLDVPERSFRHVLVGGRSNSQAEEPHEILPIIRHIKATAPDLPIYLMCLPPEDTSVLREYHDAGVTEIGFNLEVFDRDIARRLMPGKGSVSTSQYFGALKSAVELWGNTGNVRSALVIGLEPKKSLLAGVEALCKIGVAPILSVFRPIPGTKMEHVIPPGNEELYRLRLEAEDICARFHLELGPSCPDCKNNTLS